MVGYVPGRMGLAIIRHNTRLLRRSRSKYREVLEIEDAAGYEDVREKNFELIQWFLGDTPCGERLCGKITGFVAGVVVTLGY